MQANSTLGDLQHRRPLIWCFLLPPSRLVLPSHRPEIHRHGPQSRRCYSPKCQYGSARKSSSNRYLYRLRFSPIGRIHPIGAARSTRPTSPISNIESSTHIHASTLSSISTLPQYVLGLTRDQVKIRLEQYGLNIFPENPPTPWYIKLLEQLQDRLVFILIVAALGSFGLAVAENWNQEQADIQSYVEPLVIIMFLALNASVGLAQEARAENALKSLKEYESNTCTVFRRQSENSENPSDPEIIQASELVPGDLVLLSVGERVPADLRIAEVLSSAFMVDQSIITGESEPVIKYYIDPVTIDPRKPLSMSEKYDTLFCGTTVVRGKCLAVVETTGESTALGQIRSSLKSGPPKEANKEDNEKDQKAKGILDGFELGLRERTPLQLKLEEFGDLMSKIVLSCCVIIWGLNIGKFQTHGSFLDGALYYFKTSVALAVAAVPEGLPAVVSTCLALGAARMAKRNAITRYLPSVETLGCTEVICTDKTGTLTSNSMRASKLLIPSRFGPNMEGFQEFSISGNGYIPEGQWIPEPEASSNSSNLALKEIIKICCFCNDASLDFVSNSQGEISVQRQIGESTELALLVLAEKILRRVFHDDEGYKAHFGNQDRIRKVATLEFSRKRKSMSVLIEEEQSSTGGAQAATASLLVKGAPETVLSRCKYIRDLSFADGRRLLSDHERRMILSSEWNGLRRLVFAVRDHVGSNVIRSQLSDENYVLSLESDLTFVGLVGIYDPPRPEVKASVEIAQRAGIRVIVITGDNATTAMKICEETSVIPSSTTDSSTTFVLTGSQFASMNDEQAMKALDHVYLFARTDPLDKYRVVDLLKRKGLVVAMTGDGVNDAPALKHADIGVAMGSGTKVAQEASDMVLADNNFATIVAAVEEGRSIYQNIRQLTRYLISSNIGEVFSIFLASCLGLPDPFLPVQLLFCNLVTDGLPAAALSMNPTDRNVMLELPRRRDARFFDAFGLVRFLTVGTYCGTATIVGFLYYYMVSIHGPQYSWEELVMHAGMSVEYLQSVAPSIMVHGSPSTADQLMFYDVQARSMALSVLVMIEMFNSLNSISESRSLVQVTPWRNVWLLAAIGSSVCMHLGTLYVPFFANMFGVTWLDASEWPVIIGLAFPVIFVEEGFKAWLRATRYKQ